MLGGVTARHVENLVRSGRMPEPVYLGRIPRWRLAELMDWIEAGCPVVDSDRLARWDTAKATSSSRAWKA